MTGEFQKIEHVGGNLKIRTRKREGIPELSIGFAHSKPTPCTLFLIYASRDGIPLQGVPFSGFSSHENGEQPPRCSRPVLIASDAQGLFGQSCYKCNKYWRSKGVPSYWHATCPYCGFKGRAHEFLTDSQRLYIEEICDVYSYVVSEGKEGEYEINLDEIADSINNEVGTHPLTYTQESQQTKYECTACCNANDIIGSYGYCSCCGTRNDFQLLNSNFFPQIRKDIDDNENLSGILKRVVSKFDAYAENYTSQLLAHVPLTPRRRAQFQGRRFHDIAKVHNSFLEVFGIDIFEGLKITEIELVQRSFHRRHLYEHSDGIVDEKYLQDSKDTDVRVGQLIRETREDMHQLVQAMIKISKNIHQGFHSIIIPEKSALVRGN